MSTPDTSLLLPEQPSPEASPSVSRPFREDLLALAPPGRILELSGRARTSLAARLLARVQAEGDPVAWVTGRGAGLYPPDLTEAGIDLDRLVVVRIPEGEEARRGPQAAELLLRTGAFGAVVLDAVTGVGEGLGSRTPSGARGYTQRTTAWQGRLLGILRTHEARLILLTESEKGAETNEIGPSMGPLVSVRLMLERERLPSGELRIVPRIVKDKSSSLAGLHAEAEPHRGPSGSRAPFDALFDPGEDLDPDEGPETLPSNVLLLRRAR